MPHHKSIGPSQVPSDFMEMTHVLICRIIHTESDATILQTGLIIHGKWNVYIKEKELHKILLFEMYGKQSQSI